MINMNKSFARMKNMKNHFLYNKFVIKQMTV